MMRRLLLVLAFVTLATSARAQTPPTVCTAPCTLTRAVPFSVVADHDGVDTDGYRLRQNGVIVRDVPVTTLVAGSITLAFATGLPPGSYTFTVSAYNGDLPENESLSDPIVLTVKRGKPVKPSNGRVVR